MSILYAVIGRQLRTARKAQGLTQEDIADKLGISLTHYGKIERGDRHVNLQRLGELSLLLNTPIEKLVEGSVSADQNEDAAPRAATEKESFLDRMEEISKGCSPQALHLMVQLCAAVASDDKNRHIS